MRGKLDRRCLSWTDLVTSLHASGTPCITRGARAVVTLPVYNLSTPDEIPALASVTGFGNLVLAQSTGTPPHLAHCHAEHNLISI